MKAGLTTSLALHAVALGFGLFSLSSPREMAIADVESFPVDIVPIEEFAQSIEGKKDAPVAEKPAPVPTTREEVVPDAQEVGDNTVDLPTPATPEPRPRPVEAAEAPPPSPTPVPPTPEPAPTPEPTPAQPQPAPTPAPAPEPEPVPAAVPATEVTPQPEPRQEVKPDPAPQTTVAEAPSPDAVTLPTSAPAPQARPQPPQAQTAKTPERREQERPAREQPQQRASTPSESDKALEDQVAALLNRDKPSGGGAQRSSEQAALGGRQTTGSTLSQSEMDLIRSQLMACWNVPAGAVGASDLQTTVKFRLDPSGTLEGQPRVERSSGDNVFDDSTLRAVRVCNQRGFQLPSSKYDAWAEVTVNFDPRDMF